MIVSTSGKCMECGTQLVPLSPDSRKIQLVCPNRQCALCPPAFREATRDFTKQAFTAAADVLKGHTTPGAKWTGILAIKVMDCRTCGGPLCLGDTANGEKGGKLTHWKCPHCGEAYTTNWS